jgi:type IV secretory pathway VirB2 component (pilin)
MKDSAARSGTALFWAALLSFALVDLAFVAGPQLSLPMARIAPVLAYALLGGFALGLAVIAAIALGAWRARSAPSLGEVLRGSVVLILVVLHATLLFVATRRH